MEIFWFVCQNNLIVKAEKHFWKKTPFDTHSTAKLPHIAILEKNQVFFLKNASIFWKKNPNCERFEKFLYLSHIPWQVWYNFVKNVNNRQRHWQNCVEKSHHLNGCFSFEILNMAENIKTISINFHNRKNMGVLGREEAFFRVVKWYHWIHESLKNLYRATTNECSSNLIHFSWNAHFEVQKDKISLKNL